MLVEKKEFFKLQNKLDQVAFTQTKAWLESSDFENMYKVVYYVDKVDKPSIASWGIITSKKILGNKLILNGTSTKKDITSNEYKEFFTSLITDGYNRIDISDIQEYSTDFEIGIRRAGFTRPITLDLCPMSLVVELDKEPKYSRMWKRNVKKSIEVGNQFVVVDNPSLEDAKTFVLLFNQLKERKGLGFSLSPEEILTLLSSSKYKLFFMEDKDHKKICSRIEYMDNQLAYDTYAANSSDGLKWGGIYHIQQSVFEYFKECGFLKFDYGRISPSADHMDNIYISKSMSGGKPISYNGQWHYSKSRYVDILLFVVSYGLKKSRIY